MLYAKKAVCILQDSLHSHHEKTLDNFASDSQHILEQTLGTWYAASVPENIWFVKEICHYKLPWATMITTYCLYHTK